MKTLRLMLVGTEVICEAEGVGAAVAGGKEEAGSGAAVMGQGVKAGPLREAIVEVAGVGEVGGVGVILEVGEAVGLGIRNSEIGMVVKVVGVGSGAGVGAAGEGGGPIEASRGAARPLIEVNIFHYLQDVCKLEFIFVH